MDNRCNSIIDNEPKILFEPKILWRFLLENKFLPDNGFFDLEPIDVYQEYKKYVKQHNLQMVSLTKNLDSFFNKMYLRNHEYFCYIIKEIEPNEFKKLIDQLYKDYQKNNKYSTPSGFIKKDNTIILIKNMIDSILEDIETTKFRQIDILPNETNVFIHKTPPINLYTTKLNQIELFEYLNLVSQVIENFEPEIKDQKKTPQQPESKYPFENVKHDYFIIYRMFATNEIEIIEDEFLYRGKKYESGNGLNKVINSTNNFEPDKKFTQYLNDFKSKSGDKYFLKTFDSVINKPHRKNIKRLREIREYFKESNIKVKNQNFIKAFKEI